MSVLDVRNASRRFGSLVAVRDVSLRVERGELRAIIGPNGAGNGARVEADAIRAVFNSYFRAGTLDGKPVAVRMPLNLTVPGR